MTAYVIGQITVKDPEKWAEYRSQVPETLAPWGAELVLRGTRATVLSGQHPHTDTVVIKFPNMEAVVEWHNSASYQALVPLRIQAAEVDLVSYEADS
ncbi:DUF1330 domain-containing protein [Marinobacter sp. 71-i]|uniref:DUF1330 domain-containing protein n=1 Tax=Marinobacter iranensis TaxID=2962607 RepID=A0ABT5YFD5_9GAMM|nr:DUF1330 domain-containing protein [Marinobacter iranensis]MDF0752405.1 DUF1330 domain-containing protein [Marinobacter iranensis]